MFIMLEDVNDEIPLFTEREQETVLEGEPVGSKVTQVNAIDKDGTFPNNQVDRCSSINATKRTDIHRKLYERQFASEQLYRRLTRETTREIFKRISETHVDYLQFFR